MYACTRQILVAYENEQILETGSQVTSVTSHRHKEAKSNMICLAQVGVAACNPAHATLRQHNAR
jgi:hypothetical protein